VDTNELDQKIAALGEHADAWAKLSVDRRIEYLRKALKGTIDVADAQVAAAVQAKGVEPGSSQAAEDYLAGPVVQARTIRLLIDSLKQIKDSGQVQIKKKAISTRSDGQVVVEVFPTGLADSLLFGGFSAAIWQEPEVTAETLNDHIAEFYREQNPTGRVSLVLGAGNVASIGPLDVIHKLFVEGQVVLLKMNPVNDYLGPFIETAFASLIEDGFVALAYGGADVGEYLCQHAGIQEIHITGSDRTHDAIVYGVGPEGQARKAENNPRTDKRITSELGNVSPVIIMPGSWTESELRFQAENVATQMTNNGGFNCNAAKVLIMHDEWSQRREFLDMLKAVLASLPQRPAYYPGAEQRYDHFVSNHAQAEPIGERTDGVLPWTLIPGIDSAQRDDICFTEESFCGVTAVTTLGGSDAGEFLQRAVVFCNDVLWGTLNASIVLHPRTQARFSAALEQAIADLKYGSVAVNHWPGLCYGFGSTAWGAFPGHTMDDIQSGIGAVHNTYLFDKPQKTVLRGPFVVKPKPPWFVTHRNTHGVAKRMMAMEASPSLWKVPGIAIQAMKG
jgi:acyl-CoA reductase-like NAD-dependent aldehyde dehydrogenase